LCNAAFCTGKLQKSGNFVMKMTEFIKWQAARCNRDHLLVNHVGMSCADDVRAGFVAEHDKYKRGAA
jgi:hypothetical protein